MLLALENARGFAFSKAFIMCSLLMDGSGRTLVAMFHNRSLGATGPYESPPLYPGGDGSAVLAGGSAGLAATGRGESETAGAGDSISTVAAAATAPAGRVGAGSDSAKLATMGTVTSLTRYIPNGESCSMRGECFSTAASKAVVSMEAVSGWVAVGAGADGSAPEATVDDSGPGDAACSGSGATVVTSGTIIVGGWATAATISETARNSSGVTETGSGATSWVVSTSNAAGSAVDSAPWDSGPAVTVSGAGGGSDTAATASEPGWTVSGLAVTTSDADGGSDTAATTSEPGWTASGLAVTTSDAGGGSDAIVAGAEAG